MFFFVVFLSLFRPTSNTQKFLFQFRRALSLQRVFEKTSFGILCKTHLQPRRGSFFFFFHFKPIISHIITPLFPDVGFIFSLVWGLTFFFLIETNHTTHHNASFSRRGFFFPIGFRPNLWSNISLHKGPSKADASFFFLFFCFCFLF